jgi:DNA-binding LytR/AlgR family response regulator
MGDVATDRLRDKIILIVEDEYMLAVHVADFLQAEGARIVGPVGTVRAAMVLVEKGDRLDAAVLDVNIRGEPVYPVADALIAREVPILFVTGYEELLLQRPYQSIARCSKPYNRAAIIGVLEKLTTQAGRP